jgi:hypothetical protein
MVILEPYFCFQNKATMHAAPEHRSAMLSLIESWHQSGLSQKAFCDQAQMKAHTFHYWYKCYRNQNNSPVARPAERFIELGPQTVLPEPAIELLLAGGHRILFHHPVAASFIKAIIS